MARLSTMTHDKKTGRLRRKNVTRSRIAKKASRKRVGKKLKAATKLKISRAVKKTSRTHRTKFGRRALTAKRSGVGRKAGARRKVGRPAGFSHSAKTRKKMAAAHRARWKQHGARYRKARKR